MKEKKCALCQGTGRRLVQRDPGKPGWELIPCPCEENKKTSK
jgi:hypothetical protein